MAFPVLLHLTHPKIFPSPLQKRQGTIPLPPQAGQERIPLPSQSVQRLDTQSEQGILYSSLQVLHFTPLQADNNKDCIINMTATM